MVSTQISELPFASVTERVCLNMDLEDIVFNFLIAGMEPKGTRITLRITDPLDLNRDVLKVCLKCCKQKNYFQEAKINRKACFDRG